MGSTTLLLNADYQALRVLPFKRAVVMVLSEKAEVVVEGDTVLRSASTEVKVPSVIRLTRFIKIPYRATIPLNRRAVVARDHGLCGYCSRPADTIDHIVPRARGGRHEWTNVTLACRRCNGKKGDRLLEELGWTLERKPYAPKGTYWLLIGIGAKVDPAWEPYLQVAA